MSEVTARIAVAGFCLTSLLITGDVWLYVFSFLVFVVAGVPWELSHWRDKQEFSHVDETREE